MTIAKVISQKLNYNEKQISQVLALTDAGNTVPFIARYRKEMTGNLDEVAIREIIEKANAYLELSKRKTAILASIEKQDMLTIALANKIKGIDNL
ncbi:Tex-like N-terminal domain-containing protein [Periweissella beninensis]